MHGPGVTARRLAARPLVPVAGVAIGVALALVVGLERRDAPLARWCVVATIVAGLGATLACGRGRQRCTSRAWLSGSAQAVATWRRRRRGEALGATIWAVLVAAFAGWDTFSFSSQRADLPTLSHYLGMATATGWGRGLLAAGWVAWGAWVALGWRQPRP